MKPRDGERGAAREVPPAPGLGPFAVAALVGAGLVAWGAYGHWRRDAAAEATLDRIRTLVPQVRTVVARRAEGSLDLRLPGETRAFATAAIAARATGYVAERRVDIGSRVRAGDLLLRIAAPELDQQLAQAEAQLGQLRAQQLQAEARVAQARAGVDLAHRTNDRTATLAGQGWASRQSADTSQAGVQSQAAALAGAEAGVAVAAANIRAQEAAVARARALVAFTRVLAPFDGVVTARTVDVGDLVRADGGGTPLLSVDADSTLRIAVDVPQSLSTGVRPGVAARITVPQFPGRSFEGTVERSSVALLTASRTLTVQIDVPNPDRVLRAGLHTDVTLAVPRERPGVAIPAEAAVLDRDGFRVAVLGADDRVAWRRVALGRDLGQVLELASGLDPEAHVISSPSPDLRDGQAVRREDGAPPHPALQAAAR